MDYLPFNLHYSESDSPFNFPEFSKSYSIAFPRLGLAYFYRKGLQRTGYSFILTNIVLGLNEKVVPFLIYRNFTLFPVGFNFPLFQLAPCSRAITTGFARWTRASTPFWTQSWQLGVVFNIIIVLKWNSRGSVTRSAERTHCLVLAWVCYNSSLLGCNALGCITHC